MLASEAYRQFEQYMKDLKKMFYESDVRRTKKRITELVDKARIAISFLGDPNNKFMDHAELCVDVLGVDKDWFVRAYDRKTINEIYQVAADLRRSNLKPFVAAIDDALARGATTSKNPALIKLALERFDGFSAKTVNVVEGGDKPVKVEHNHEVVATKLKEILGEAVEG